METVADLPETPMHAKRQQEFQEEEPTFVHARPIEERRRERRSHRSRYEPLRESSVNAPVGAWTVIETVARWWYWIFIAAIAGMLAGYFFGQKFFETGYVATVEIMRLDPGVTMEFYKPRALSEDGFAKVLKTPELVQQVAKTAKPPLNPDDLTKRVIILNSGESEVFTLNLTAQSPERAVELANLYAEEAKKFTAELQKREVADLVDSLKSQVAHMDWDLEAVTKQIRGAVRTAPAPGQGITVREQLQKEEQELLRLRTSLTDAHPKVQQELAVIEILKKQLAAAQTQANATEGTNTEPMHDVDFSVLRRQGLDQERMAFVARQREAEHFAEKPPGYFSVFAPAEEKTIRVADAKFKILMTTVLGGMVGFGTCIVLVLFVEVFDQRIKTLDDLKRVTGLRILATLGNTRRMTAAEQNNWAFRTWTALQCGLSASPNHGLICGITSAGHGEGRSTWVNLLAKAAGQCGFRVLTIGTVQVADEETLKNCTAPHEDDGESAEAADGSANGRPHASQEPDFDPTETSALMTRILTSPSQVTQQLTRQDPQQFVHIPLPGWVWNLERRKQWQGALSQWKRIEHVVIFVELPPASMPEAVLLATKLPNVIWLSRSGKARSNQTRSCIQTLRDARVNLVGCVMNKDSGASVKKCFSRWVSAWVCAAVLGLSGQIGAQEAPTVAPPANPAVVEGPILVAAARPQTSVSNLSFSASSRRERAEWQKRLTLGPGDVLNISLFGQLDADRKEVPIAPDGRISFLQATDVMATGLTVDELRAKLDEELSKFYRAPRTLISPVAFHSKKYYVLGKVSSRGVYPLDRPISIIEAVARAHGIETGLLDENNVSELADLQKSFLMRGGKRLEVNLERLFQEGDLSQNVLLEPGDFLFFASMAIKEVYVLGEVRNPGPMVWTDSATAVTAIANRGGFNERAYKSKVVVIRGSLNNPRTFIVNVWGTFEARQLDFKLEPKDIVYVHYRPFIYVEELLDLAITGFLQSMSAGTAGELDPLIRKPLF